MPLFKRRPSRVVPSAILGRLAEFGAAHLDARMHGAQPDVNRFGWEFIGPAFNAVKGSEGNRAIDELYEAAQSDRSRDDAIMGAYALIAEATPESRHPRFLELLDASLERIRQYGLASGHLNRYEADRWNEVHGDLRSSFDGIHETGAPPAGSVAVSEPPAPGQSRLLALTEPLPEGNAFFAETRADGSMIVYSERQHSSENPVRERCDESYLGEFASYEELLRRLGEMFGVRPYWAEAELEPFFPLRRDRG